MKTVKTKADLHKYIRTDYNRQNMRHPLMARLTWGEHDLTRRYLNTLRHLEYYTNTRHGVWSQLCYCYYKLKHRRNCIKTGIYIMPNTCEEGLLLPHPGFVRVDSFCEIGKNCTILPMVLIGKKRPGIEGKCVIGDNCYISAGVTILAPVKIGDDVTIGAGAVVTKDIPSGCVVTGVPGEIRKHLNCKNRGVKEL